MVHVAIRSFKSRRNRTAFARQQAVTIEPLERRVLLSGASFLAAQAFATGDHPQSVTVGDFNGDGKGDLATANHNGSSVSILLGNGNGTFQSKSDYVVGNEPRYITVGDFNGDGKSDLATANSFGNTVSILLGNGNGTFQSKTDYGVGSVPYCVTVGDFNGDGKSDLATANYYSYTTVSILLGNGDGTFQSKTDYTVGNYPFSVTVGDFNGDGKSDLATAIYGSDKVSILLGNGNGTFQSKTDYSVGDSPFSVTVGDFNGDGKSDLATANSWGSSVSILLGNGNGTFQSKTDYSVGSHPFSVTVGDFDGDGKSDLATANNYANTVSTLLGNDDGTFHSRSDYGVGSLPYCVTVGDFNGDGKSDLATANNNGNTVSILLNNSAPAVPAYSSRPGAPATLFLDFDGDPPSVLGTQAVTETLPYRGASDNDPYSFSPDEKEDIFQIWSAVAEKYSPFNINVTTVDPGNFNYLEAAQIVIGGSMYDWLITPGGRVTGGIAPTGSFAIPFQKNTGYVFSSDHPGDVHWISEVVAHESGHIFGLTHQESDTADYYGGDGSRSPIMGRSAEWPLARGIWWLTNMEPGQNSTQKIQDDLMIISAPHDEQTFTGNGFGWAPDDHGDTPATATPLLFGDNTWSFHNLNGYSGVIETVTDADYFSFATAAGHVHFDVTNSQFGGMLDATIELQTAAGGVLWTVDTSSLGETFEIDLNAGSYRLVVRSRGSYGDLGQYSISGRFAPYSVPGDANDDNLVNFADFVVLSNNFGAQTSAGAAVGDFNGDGVVNFADFVILSNHFGQSNVAAAFAVDAVSNSPSAESEIAVAGLQAASPSIGQGLDSPRVGAATTTGQVIGRTAPKSARELVVVLPRPGKSVPQVHVSKAASIACLRKARIIEAAWMQFREAALRSRRAIHLACARLLTLTWMPR